MTIWKRILPGLRDTGAVCDGLMAVRDGAMNFYVVSAPGGLVCVDAGWRAERVAREFERLGLDAGDVVAVFLTHLHWDHARCLGLYPKASVFVGAREGSSLFATRRRPVRPWTTLRDGEAVTAAGRRVRVVDTPGHTPGSVSYVIEERFLFTGDTLRLRRGRAVPFMPWFSRDRKALARSMRRLAGIGGMEWLLTSHTGATRDVDAAFRPWREAGAAAPGEGASA